MEARFFRRTGFKEKLVQWLTLGAKLCKAIFSTGKTIRWAKVSSTNEKFVTFARRKISPNKSRSIFKWSTSESTRETSHLHKFWLYYSSGNIFVAFARQSFTLEGRPHKLIIVSSHRAHHIWTAHQEISFYAKIDIQQTPDDTNPR